MYRISCVYDDNYFAVCSDPTDPESDYLHSVESFLSDFDLPSYEVASGVKQALLSRLPHISFDIICICN